MDRTKCSELISSMNFSYTIRRGHSESNLGDATPSDMPLSFVENNLTFPSQQTCCDSLKKRKRLRFFETMTERCRKTDSVTDHPPQKHLLDCYSALFQKLQIL